jgi:hypothetical protein
MSIINQKLEEKKMEVQTRSESNGLRFFTSVYNAFEAAERDSSIWKISFNAQNGERVRLIREFDVPTAKMIWKYEPMPPMQAYLGEE